MRIPRLVRLTTVNQTPVFAHWSVLFLAVVYLIANFDRIFQAAAGIAAWLLVLIVHELGHQFVAARLGYRVVTVEIYPVHALCRFEHPETKLDAAKIAWGGVIGQFVLALPALVRLVYFGYSPFAPLNAILAICGPSNFAIGLFNLLPMRPLDGAIAWSLIPQLWTSRRPRKQKKRDKSALQIFEEMVEKQNRR